MKNIKKYRGLVNMTQKDLADFLGVSRTTVVNLENEPGYTVTEDKARQMADAFGCTIYDICSADSVLVYKPRNRAEAEALIRSVREYYNAGN